MKRDIVIAYIAGLLTVYLLKYIVFGLTAWDNIFHTERTAADTSGPYRQFAKPFMGLLG